jgi:hypothetical protein
LVANDKGDNKMIPGAVHRSPVICLTAEESPGKPQLRPFDEGRLKWGPLLPNEVNRIAQHVSMGDGRKDGKDGRFDSFNE